MNRNEVEKSRKRQLKKLLAASSPEDQEHIKAGRRAGQRLRRELEELERGLRKDESPSVSKGNSDGQ